MPLKSLNGIRKRPHTDRGRLKKLTSHLSELKVLLELAPSIQYRLPGFIGPVPLPLWIRVNTIFNLLFISIPMNLV